MSIKNVTEARQLTKRANKVLQSEQAKLATTKILRRIESMARLGHSNTRVRVPADHDEAVAANIARLNFDVSLTRSPAKDNSRASFLEIDWE